MKNAIDKDRIRYRKDRIIWQEHLCSCVYTVITDYEQALKLTVKLPSNHMVVFQNGMITLIIWF